MNTATLSNAGLELLSDADLDSVVGGEIGPVTPTIICPVGQTYDTGAGKCVATKLVVDSYESDE